MVDKTRRRLSAVQADSITRDDLLARAAGGAKDRQAFGELVVRHHARVLGLLRHLTRDQSVADDLAAQTFLRAWERLSSFRGDTSMSFGAWLSRIAYREFLQRARRQKAEQRIFSTQEAPDLPVPEPVDSAAAISPVLAVRERVDHDDRASFTTLLEACTQVQAETLYMNFVLELTHDEIARVTSRPVGTVKSHISRGKAAIKSMLEKGHDEETAVARARSSQNAVDRQKRGKQ